MKSKILLFQFGIVLSIACSSPKQKGNESNDSIASDSSKVIADNDSITTRLSLPDWAKKLGLKEPKSMQLVAGMSHLTSVYGSAEGFNSVTLVYTGNYDTAMMEASRIAKAANLPPSKEYNELRKQAARAGHGNMVKGIAYMNYDLSTRDIDFLVYVKVDDEGKLTVSATDMKQMNLQLSKHKGIVIRKK